MKQNSRYPPAWYFNYVCFQTEDYVMEMQSHHRLSSLHGVTSVTALVSRAGIHPLNMTRLVLGSCGNLKSMDCVLKCLIVVLPCSWQIAQWYGGADVGFRVLLLSLFAPSKTSTSERIDAIAPKRVPGLTFSHRNGLAGTYYFIHMCLNRRYKFTWYVLKGYLYK